MSIFKGKYFVYLANICTNSIVKTKCYCEINVLNTSLTNLVVTYYNSFILKYERFSGFKCDLVVSKGKNHHSLIILNLQRVHV